MLVKLIHSYYHYLWLLLAVVVGIKILLSFLFNKQLEGFQGLIYAIFKWYGEQDQEMAESAARKTMMRLYNVINVGMYLILVVIILSSLLPMFLTNS
jgi:type II secretory pathway component PulF